MTIFLYLQCVAMYILGQALHILLIKVPAVKERTLKANENFTWKKYWDCDWNVIIGNMVFGAMLVIGLDQIIHWKPEILDVVKWFFGGLGFAGSVIVLAKWSKYEKSLQNTIDIKTDIADGKIPPNNN